jgi:hypothetical protein
MLHWYLAVPLIVAIFCVSVLIFKVLWNTTVPQVFQFRTITFWQACKLLLIAGMLFGGGWIRHPA